MNSTHSIIRLGLAALAIGSLATPLRVSAAGDEALEKCGAPPLIHLIDGQVGDAALYNSVWSAQAGLLSMMTTCTDVRHVIFGVEAGRQLILAWTKAPPPPELSVTMDTIAALQEAHFQRHQYFATTLGELGVEGLKKVSLCVSADRLRWTFQAAGETRGARISGGRTSSGGFTCDVRYTGSETLLHWVDGDK